MPTKKTADTDAATAKLDAATAQQADAQPTEQLGADIPQQSDAQPTEKLDGAASPFELFTETPAPAASAAPAPTSAQEHRSMRGTAIAWGIIILLIAAIAWFTSTVDVWQADSRTIVTSIVLVGAVLVGIGMLGAIVRAVTRR